MANDGLAEFDTKAVDDMSMITRRAGRAVSAHAETANALRVWHAAEDFDWPGPSLSTQASRRVEDVSLGSIHPSSVARISTPCG